MSEKLSTQYSELVHDKDKAEVMAYEAKSDMDEYLRLKQDAAEDLADGDLESARDNAEMAAGHKRYAGHIAAQAAKVYEDPSVGLLYEHDKEKAEFVAHAMNEHGGNNPNIMNDMQYTAEQVYDLHDKDNDNLRKSA